VVRPGTLNQRPEACRRESSSEKEDAAFGERSGVKGSRYDSDTSEVDSGQNVRKELSKLRYVSQVMVVERRPVIVTVGVMVKLTCRDSVEETRHHNLTTRTVTECENSGQSSHRRSHRTTSQDKESARKKRVNDEDVNAKTLTDGYEYQERKSEYRW